MSTNTQPESPISFLSALRYFSRAPSTPYWFTRARDYQIHPSDVNTPSPPVARGRDPGLMNLPTRKVIDFELPNLRNKTLTEFLNPTPLSEHSIPSAY
jgi:hypothetical protein